MTCRKSGKPPLKGPHPRRQLTVHVTHPNHDRLLALSKKRAQPVGAIAREALAEGIPVLEGTDRGMTLIVAPSGNHAVRAGMGASQNRHSVDPSIRFVWPGQDPDGGQFARLRRQRIDRIVVDSGARLSQVERVELMSLLREETVQVDL
jgi:hypothetical protein